MILTMIKNISFFALIFLIFVLSCSEKSKPNSNQPDLMNLLTNISQPMWDNLATKKIYFGHQSVGFNVVDGVSKTLEKNPHIRLRIAEGQSAEIFVRPVFAHDRNGKNGDPKSKIDAFCASLNNGLGTSADMAGFKFCYVDFKHGTDVEDVFQYYKTKMTDLREKYPELKIIHFTVPIRSLQKGPKGFINKLLGREIGVTDNTVRQEFNALLLKEFGDESIFDLAKYESTFPDGTRCFTLIDDKEIYSMVPDYTYDSGHLSDIGKQRIGMQFLTFLAELSYAGNH